MIGSPGPIPDADHLAARDDGREKSHVVEREFLAGQLVAGIEWVALEHRDDLGSLIVANDPVSRFVIKGEPGDTHDLDPI